MSQFLNIYSHNILPLIVPVTIYIICKDLEIEQLIVLLIKISSGADKMAPKAPIFIHVSSVVGGAF